MTIFPMLMRYDLDDLTRTDLTVQQKQWHCQFRICFNHRPGIRYAEPDLLYLWSQSKRPDSE